MAKAASTRRLARRPARRPVVKGPRTAIFTGSFDPLTLGHLDLIQRASRLFDELIVAIGEARDKRPLFTVEERIAILQEATSELGNVTTESFSGLAVAFAQRRGAVALIRGIRSATDYSYEVQMALMNRALAPEIETLFIPTSPEYSHISSSLAKEIALHQGDLKLLVPPAVARKLAQRVGG